MAGDSPLILRCELCNKPFDRESTLKRHGYYCRSRKVDVTSRLRSCLSCAKSKSRCDNGRPKCQRCMTRAIACNYPATTSRGSKSKSYLSNDRSTSQQKSSPSLATGGPSNDDLRARGDNSNMVLHDTFETPDSTFTNLDETFFDWTDLDVNFTDILNMQSSNTVTEQPLSGLPPPTPQSLPSVSRMPQIQELMFSPRMSIPRNPPDNIRFFIRRPDSGAGSRRVADLMLHTLKSYPLMMRQNHLPPFIHPHLLAANTEDSRMEPLVNCMSLMLMIENRVRANRKLFWRNVHMECERFRAEHLTWGKWEFLAAINAICVYILVRLSEGETEHNNFDSLLLGTLTMVAKQFALLDITSQTVPATYSSNLDVSWSDWIYDESSRRICVIYQIINMLVYFEPAAMCNLETNLVLAPLPTKKQLWEASDEIEWRLISETESGTQSNFGLAANGELVTLDEVQWPGGPGGPSSASFNSKRSSGNRASWEEWCSGMDGLGGLIVLAASLQAPS